MQTTLQSTLDSIESTPWSYVEVALWLAFQLGEGLPDSVIREKGGVFQQMMTTLLKSSVSAHPHQAVQLLFFEIVVRYYRFFLVQPDYLIGVLRAFLDSRGLYNTHASVRSRVCYLLLRFVKQTLKSATAAFVEVVQKVMELLRKQPADQLEAPDDQLLRRLQASDAAAVVAPPSALNGGSREVGGLEGRLSEQEQLNLYEAAGLLLGAGLSPPEQIAELLNELLKPPLGQLERLCTAGLTLPPNVATVGGGEELLEARAAAVARCASVVAVVSKGFNNLGEGQALLGPRACFSRAMQLCLSALLPFGKYAEVRQRTLMLLHRMVETLSEDLVSFLHPSLPQLLASAELKEVQEVVTLLNQLVLKFKGKLAVQISQLVSPLTASTFAHIAHLDAAIAASSSAAVGAKAGGQSEEVNKEIAAHS